ncbi:MAG: hypothetical protein ACI94Y_002879 [Maribacter sp.]|jgi:hypothetical protein
MEFLHPNTYIGFTKRIYKNGGFCTKIRFKFTGRDEVFYSESYEGCVYQCQIDNSFSNRIDCYPQNTITSNIMKIYKSGISLDEKITQIKAIGEEDSKAIYIKALIGLYRKKKDYETAFSYTEQLEKMNTGSGKCFMYKGDLYTMSAGECFSDNNNMLEYHAIVISAIEEWEKARQFQDTKEESKKMIKKYSTFLLEKSDLFFHGETYHIGCWVNKTVKLWKKDTSQLNKY